MMTQIVDGKKSLQATDGMQEEGTGMQTALLRDYNEKARLESMCLVISLTMLLFC